MTESGLGAFDSLAHNDAVLELSRRDLFIAAWSLEKCAVLNELKPDQKRGFSNLTA